MGATFKSQLLMNSAKNDDDLQSNLTDHVGVKKSSEDCILQYTTY